MWIPPEEKDQVLVHAPTSKSVACFSAVSIDTGKLVAAFEPVFNAESFQRFLVQLLRHGRYGHRLLLLLDNAKYHHARALQPWLQQHQMQITLLFLKPHSPELNPIERVWKLTRRLATHNRYFATLTEVVDAVQERFDIWKKPNEQLTKLWAII